jgi:hypothetical protein
LRGRIAARHDGYELALYGAWQSERFARVDKLKPLSSYLKETRKKPVGRVGDRQTPQEMLAALQNIAGTGVALKIERIR